MEVQDSFSVTGRRIWNSLFSGINVIDLKLVSSEQLFYIQTIPLVTWDACLFQVRLKKLSSDQDLSIGSKLSSGDQLYQKVQKVFWDKNSIPSIPCAYTGLYHISYAILQYGGYNNYLSKRQGVSFGIHKHFTTTLKLMT